MIASPGTGFVIEPLCKTLGSIPAWGSGAWKRGGWQRKYYSISECLIFLVILSRVALENVLQLGI